MNELAHGSTTGTILEIVTEYLFDESHALVRVINCFGVQQGAVLAFCTSAFEIVYADVAKGDRLAIGVLETTPPPSPSAACEFRIWKATSC